MHNETEYSLSEERMGVQVVPIAAHEISLTALARKFLQLTWLHGAVAFLCFVVATGFILLSPTLYRADGAVLYEESKLASIDSDAAPSPANSPSMLSSLLTGGARVQTQLPQDLALLRTRSFLAPLIDRQHLLPLIFADRWRPDTKTWNTDHPPATEDGYNTLVARMYTHVDAETGIITYGIAAPTPQASVQLSNIVLQAFDQSYRRERSKQSQWTLTYIQAEERDAASLDIKNLLLSLHEKELRSQILLTVETEIPFRMVDPPILPKSRFSPNIKLTYAVAIAAALSLSLFLTMIWPWATSFGEFRSWILSGFGSRRPQFEQAGWQA